MRWNIASKPLDNTLPFAIPINGACVATNCPTLLAYAIAWHESIQGQVNGKWNAATVESFDGGKGVFQLTSSWPTDWKSPSSNAVYACENYIIPDALHWYRTYGMTGEDLVRCTAASFNAGIGGAEAGHRRGDVDRYTTDNYGARVLAIYKSLLATGRPVPGDLPKAA